MGDSGPAGSAGAPGEKGAEGRQGEKGTNGALGPNGRNGINGVDGPRGNPGKDGEAGDAGDNVKSEVTVHLNALKGYVDMKFDVLKGILGGKPAAEEDLSSLDSLQTTMAMSMASM